ncbi:hypothetical protein [Caviibacterium pharyngocola]|uniref:Uncharacterized protein n=1 Tax=Caviibacterium pharyngocola TaxID=28159 RepID=A0A2M8RTC8_9PAST|nr:hypothetical protein [Caviibacterium pharyngocola]PJG82150.1 hypothetical protein CVP04_10870 [Caviibacterium pharyngocola]
MNSQNELQRMRAQQADLAAELLAEMQQGKYQGLTGAKMLRTFWSELNQETANNAVRQYRNFVKKYPQRNIALAKLLGFEPKNNLLEYSLEVRTQIALFIFVAKGMVPFFDAPMVTNDFKRIA